MEVGYDEKKFAELLLYVASALQNDRAGGATKLNKVVFFAEFTHLRRHHSVISGCEFQKLPHGPAPRQLLPVRHRLIDSGDAELIEEDFLGRPQHRLVPKRSADSSVFQRRRTPNHRRCSRATRWDDRITSERPLAPGAGLEAHGNR